MKRDPLGLRKTMTMSFVRSDYYNKTELKDLGFTESMINALLPEPTLRPNPFYRSGSPMRLYPKDVVDSVIESPEFKVDLEKSKARRSSAMRAVKTKREKTKRDVDEAISRIKVRCPKGMRTRDGALAAGVRHKERLDASRGEFGDYRNADDETRERWTVNYIRHELTDYESELFDMAGKVGCGEEYWRYKKAVLDAISESYPFLADACERIKARS